MRLAEYLDERGESQKAFSERAAIPRQTVSRIIAGDGITLATARLVVSATGGRVSFEDLPPHDGAEAA